MAKKELTKKQRIKRRRRRRRRIFFVFEILILLFLAAGLYIYGKLGNLNITELNFEDIGVNEGVRENSNLTGYMTIALVGIDSRDGLEDGGVNSDTMIIASINNDDGKVRLASIYRDTYLRIGEDEDGNGIYGKANAAYCQGGAEQMLTMMNKSLDLDISQYVTVDFSAVAKAVDLLGGVDVELSEEECVHVNSYSETMSEEMGEEFEAIEETAGVHHLTGIQTVAYARIRYTAGNDFRRAARQREVIYKIVEKAKNSDLATLNSILDEVFPLVATNLTKTEILKLGIGMLGYDIEEQTGFPFDHLYGERVMEAMPDGCDCVLPVTLESNVIELHEFLYPGVSYTPSDSLIAYSNRIIEISGFGESSRLDVSEDGSLAQYRESWKSSEEEE